MHGSIAPSLVEEAACAIQMLEIILICFASPKLHVGNFEVAPEMTGRVAIGLDIMSRPSRAVLQPLPCIVFVLILRMGGQEFQRLGPQGWDALRGIVQIDGEAVGFVAIGHVAEDIVVDVTEEVNFGLHAPIITRIGKGRVVVEEAGIPTAHLVVGDHISVLDALFFKYEGGFGEEVIVDPGGDGPMFFWNLFY